MRKTFFFCLFLFGTGFFLFTSVTAAQSLGQSLKGRILLQVESKGEAWYIYPNNLKRYYLGRPDDAFNIMRQLGLGAKHDFIVKYLGKKFPISVYGKILLDVGDKGKAYYIFPQDGQGYYLGKPADAFNVMRNLGLGITNNNLAKIISSTEEATASPSTTSEPSTTSASTALDTPEMIKSSFQCSVCKTDEKCVAGSCLKLSLDRKNFCGNYICEDGESFDGKADDPSKTKTSSSCFLDCNPPCLAGAACNNYAEVQCGCSESDILKKRHGCVASAQSCSTCGVQQSLFNEVLSIQTEVIKCLSNYFEYKPNRLIYKVFNNPNLEACTLKEGCEGQEGGVGGADYVMFHNLNGARSYGQVVPTKPEQITADVHETTHYFVFQMLHGAPSWFQEAIAIQTNERLNCSSRQTKWGDGYLEEKNATANSGIVMGNGRYLDYNFYRDLRDGKISLTAEQSSNEYIKGTLLIMGLKEDYKCGFNCLKDVVIKLREKEQNNCRGADISKCAVTLSGNSWLVGWIGTGLIKDDSEKIVNGLIKQTIDGVVKKDTDSLFKLVGLKY